MKKRLLFPILFLLPILSFAQDAQEAATEVGLDQKIDEFFGAATGWFVSIIFYQIPFTEEVSVYWVLFPLILGAIYFTLYFKGINFTGFFTSINIVRGKYDDIDDHSSLVAAGDSTPGGDIKETIKVEKEGEVSHFQALTAAL